MIGVMGAWGLICGFYAIYIKNDANNYKVCPQTPTYMPDGTEKKFTFKIEPEGIEKICEFEDGSIGVHVTFKDRYLYPDKKMDFPFPFNEGYWKIPSALGQSFKFMSEGEFWHGGMIVTTSNCEHISWYVREVVEIQPNRYVPVGVIADCSFRHEQFLRNNGGSDVENAEMHTGEMYELLFNAIRERYDDLYRHTETLEDAHETVLNQKGPQIKKATDHVMSSARQRVHLITDTSEPLLQRIFKWKNIAYVILIVLGFIVFARFVMGWI